MKRPGFTIVELLIVVVLISIFAGVAISRMQLSLITKYKSETLVHKINTDLRLARQMAITYAATNSAGFALIIDNNAHSYQVKNLLSNAIVSSSTIDTGVTISGGTNFQFGPLGNLIAGSDTTVDITAAGKKSTLTIVPGTGTVKLTES